MGKADQEIINPANIAQYGATGPRSERRKGAAGGPPIFGRFQALARHGVPPPLSIENTGGVSSAVSSPLSALGETPDDPYQLPMRFNIDSQLETSGTGRPGRSDNSQPGESDNSQPGKSDNGQPGNSGTSLFQNIISKFKQNLNDNKVQENVLQNNGQSALPQDNGLSAPPQDNGPSATPQDNGQSPPQDNGQSAPPQDNGPSATPQDNGQSPPQDNGQSAPPQLAGSGGNDQRINHTEYHGQPLNIIPLSPTRTHKSDETMQEAPPLDQVIHTSQDKGKSPALPFEHDGATAEEPQGQEKIRSRPHVFGPRATNRHRGLRGWTYPPPSVQFLDPHQNFGEVTAIVDGAFSRAGWMRISLPSLNEQYPNLRRYFIVSCSEYGQTWGKLPRLSERDLAGLRKLRKLGHQKPKITAVASSPQYTTEPQSNPFHQLELDIPWDNRWHSKSDVESVWGNMESRMQRYWLKTGQPFPSKPRPEAVRIHMQEFAATTLMKLDGKNGQAWFASQGEHKVQHDQYQDGKHDGDKNNQRGNEGDVQDDLEEEL